jgi:hypothetical protein
MIKNISSQILESDNKEGRWFCKVDYKCQHYLQKSLRLKMLQP